MASIINQASATGTGSVTLLAPVTNSIQTLSLPDATGTVAIASGDLGTPTNLVGTNISGTANSLNAGLGVNQTWQNMTGSRALGTTYTNTSGKPISVTFSCNAGSGTQTAIVGGVTVLSSVEGLDSNQSFNFIVPTGSTYSITGSGLLSWVELR